MSDLNDEVRQRIGILSAASAWGADWDAHLMSSLLRRNEALEARLAVAREALGGLVNLVGPKDCRVYASDPQVRTAVEALKEIGND